MNRTLMTQAGRNTRVEHGDDLFSSSQIIPSSSRTYPTPFFSLPLGDARKLIPSMPQVHCVVSSPPYFRQRIYGDNSAEEIGQNRDVDDFLMEFILSEQRFGASGVNISVISDLRGILSNLVANFVTVVVPTVRWSWDSIAIDHPLTWSGGTRRDTSARTA